MAKIYWNAKKSEEAPAPTTVPDTLHDVDFMVRDGKRFPDTGAWGYAQFNYDAPSDMFSPKGPAWIADLHAIRRLCFHCVPEEVDGATQSLPPSADAGCSSQPSVSKVGLMTKIGHSFAKGFTAAKRMGSA